jgi:hypothetical protein
VTRATEDCIVLPHLFAELPLTPKMNGHQQAAAEPDLENLLPAMAESPKYAMNHGGRKELLLSQSNAKGFGGRGGARDSVHPDPA